MKRTGASDPDLLKHNKLWHLPTLWTLLGGTFTAAVSVTVYLMVGQHRDLAQMVGREVAFEFTRSNMIMLALFVSQALLFTLGLVGITELLEQRLTAPYRAIIRTSKEIREGNLKARLRFRSGDNLDEVAEAFNQLLDDIMEQKGDDS